jgi:hypothetical protein
MDSYIAFGANCIRSQSTNNAQMTNRTSFFPIGNHLLPPQQNLRGKNGGISVTDTLLPGYVNMIRQKAQAEFLVRNDRGMVQYT